MWENYFLDLFGSIFGFGNHNFVRLASVLGIIVTDYRLNANHNPRSGGRRTDCNWLSPKCKSQLISLLTLRLPHCNWLSPKCKSQPIKALTSSANNCNWLSPKCKSQLPTLRRLHNSNCNWLSPKCKSQLNAPYRNLHSNCNWLSPKCKSQPVSVSLPPKPIVTDYRLNANHNHERPDVMYFCIVTDYRLNANHNKTSCG